MLSNQYNQQSDILREQVGVDVTQAYRNYQLQRLGTEMNQTLGSGAKSYLTNMLDVDINRQLQSVYSNYLMENQQLRASEMEQMAKLRQSYGESQDAINKSVAAAEQQWLADNEKRAEVMLKISQATNQYFNENFYDLDFDSAKMWTTDENGNDVLSEYGKAYMELLYKSPATSDRSHFRDWGIEQGIFTAEEYDDNIAAMLEAMGVPFAEGEADTNYQLKYMKEFTKAQGYDDYYAPSDVEGQWLIDGEVVDTTAASKEFSKVYSWFTDGDVNDTINRAESILSNAPVGATKNIDGITYVKTQSGIEIDLNSWLNKYKVDTPDNLESVTGISKSGIRVGSFVNYTASIEMRNTTIPSGWYKTRYKGLYLYVKDGRMYAVSSKHFS